MTTSVLDIQTIQRPPKRPPYSKRRMLKIVAIIAVSLLAIIYVWRLRSENERLASKIAALELEASLKALENDLKVPTEALINQHVPWQPISKMRYDGMKKSGIHEFVLYDNLYRQGAKATENPIQLAEDTVGGHSDLAFGSFESFWINHAMHTCHSLAWDLESNQRLGKYFKEHPEVFKERFRPLILRIVDAPSDMVRFPACKALLEAGDRSDKVLKAVQTFLARPKHGVTYPDGKVKQEYSWEKLESIKLNERMKLGLKVPPESE